MASDYASIRLDNQKEYGNIGRWGRDVFANRYDSSTHFIFEILQNAEDALKRRKDWHGSRELRFDLSPASLRIVHCGMPFTLKDVRGVCGVGETTKDLTDIGRFGIGFKSVYTITDRPEVHSGDEDFAIEKFVFPVSAPATSRKADETEFILPLQTPDSDIHASVAEGLSKLGPRTLLFLRQIDEIAWCVRSGPSGLYIKGKLEADRNGSRRVSLVGKCEGKTVVDETWLVFSREANTNTGSLVGYIEIAFLLHQDKTTGQWGIWCVDDSPLNVFFPTVVTTHLGFLVQGPYRTTPSRDNVPPKDPWNIKLVQETAALLVESLGTLRDENLLDVAALQSLPLERSKYPDGSMFVPLFDAVRTVLSSEPLLPRFGGGWVAATNARLARTQELRELFDAKQLAAIVGSEEDVHWLSSEITHDSASTLRQYIMRELEVTELTPELILPRIDKKFLEAQPDEWILKLYEFLSGQTALIRQGRLSSIPLVRLEDGTHVVAESNELPQAFLPSAIKTDFPTVRRAVCSTTKAVDFLSAIGLTKPDAVDDVIRNLLPKYMKETVEADGDEYAADIRRIVNAFNTDLRGQQEKLKAALRKASFVRSVDTGDGSKYVSQPGDVYLATDRFKELFAGVDGVMLVDDSYACLKGEDVREMLEACGASRALFPDEVPCSLARDELRDLRHKAGYESMTWAEPIKDHTLRGLPKLLALLPKLDPEDQKKRARLLWEALKDVEQRRGAGTFAGTYSWTYYQRRFTPFEPAFVRMLNTTEWVPDADGRLQRPVFVVFDSLGWEVNPFLASKIRFKLPIIDALASEMGIEPKALEILKKRGLTSAAKLMAALGLEEKPEPESAPAPSEGPSDLVADTPGTVEDAVKKLLGGAPDPTPPIPDPTANDPVGGGATGENKGQGGGRTGGGGSHDGSRTRTPGSVGGRPFISYVGAHPDEGEKDPDRLDHTARVVLEQKAIAFIRQSEPRLQRTPTHNPGFDLFETGADEQPLRWVEVKAMTGSLHDRPVGLSRRQFECAWEHREAYWLYVVEHAGDDGARIIRIKDPAGRARTFTFDRGWLSIAEPDDTGGPTTEEHRGE